MLHADPRVITPLHGRVMRTVGQAAAAFGDIGLRLEGGTALAAYYLHHWESEDLDFFTIRELAIPEFLHFLTPYLTAAGLVTTVTRASLRSFGEVRIADAAGESPIGVKVQFAHTSPFQLAPPEPTPDGVEVGSYRDLCRGKMEAVCGRFELRDFIDIHCIIYHADDLGGVDETAARLRIQRLIADLVTCDPGMTYSYIGESFARGRSLPRVGEFPLRLLVNVTDTDLARTIEWCVSECAALLRSVVGTE